MIDFHTRIRVPLLRDNKKNRKVLMVFFSKRQISLLEQSLKYEAKKDVLIEEAINCVSPGVSSQSYCDHEIIVSLTTYGRRFYEVTPVIESIMQGTMRPNCIVLNLDYGMQNLPLPLTLKNQQRRGLEINYCEDMRSYKKLIPTLKKYPDAAIITIDDDAIYCYDLVERLVASHIESPKNIIANRVHRIALKRNGRVKNYRFWRWGGGTKEASPLNFAVGVGGVLYPPHALPEETFNKDVFMEICPFADDVWFYAMALMGGSSVKKGETRDIGGCDFLLNESAQEGALSRLNVSYGPKKSKNDIQFEAVFDKYGLWEKLRK